jgi:hypothetical protein
MRRIKRCGSVAALSVAIFLALGRAGGQDLVVGIGTTRSRVSFFMNRFRKLGFITYNGRIQVHKSLLNVVLHD